MHIDNSEPLKIKNCCFKQDCVEGEGVGSIMFSLDYFYKWGGGSLYKNESLSGGIFIALNVPNCCLLWNCKIEKDIVNGSEIIGENGDCEHIKEFLPADKEVVLEGNKLYWIFDRNPHESLPLQNGT